MTNVTVDDLPDIGKTQLQAAKVLLQQGGLSFKAPNRPTPENTFYVSSQAQLEAELGANLIIPANTNVAIIIDESFTLTKPIIKQANSSLFLYSQSSFVTLSYSGTGAMFQMDGAVVGNLTQIENIVLDGVDLTKTCFAVVDSLSFAIRQTVIQAFAKIGFVTSAVIWKEVSSLANVAGIDFIDCPSVLFADSPANALGFSPGLTLVNFIGTTTTEVVFRNSLYISTAVADEFLFIDPNSASGSSFSIVGSGIVTTVPDSLFQKGVDVAVTAVADNGSGSIRCTAVAHGQVNNTFAVLSAFFIPIYNGTFLITVIDNDTFDVEVVAFAGDDTGNINRGGLDSTDVRVLALNNPDQRDSMFIGEAGLEIFGSEISSSSLAQDAFEAITSASWVTSNLERFEDDTVTINQGRLVAKDLSTREYDVKYSATIEKSGGGSLDIGIIILVNGAEIAFNPPHTVNTGKIQISGDDLIELSTDDVIQVAVKNYDASAAVIDISQVSLVISKG